MGVGEFLGMLEVRVRDQMSCLHSLSPPPSQMSSALYETMASTLCTVVLNDRSRTCRTPLPPTGVSASFPPPPPPPPPPPRPPPLTLQVRAPGRDEGIGGGGGGGSCARPRARVPPAARQAAGALGEGPLTPPRVGYLALPAPPSCHPPRSSPCLALSNLLARCSARARAEMQAATARPAARRCGAASRQGRAERASSESPPLLDTISARALDTANPYECMDAREPRAPRLGRRGAGAQGVGAWGQRTYYR
jgi:hypothetical protein